MERAKRAAASGLTVASILLFAAALAGGAWADWVFVVVTPLFPALLIFLATSRRRRRNRLLTLGVFALGALMALSAVGIRLLDYRPTAPWLLGLPASALLLGLGLVLGPLILVGWIFAATFDDVSAAVGENRQHAGTRSDVED